MNRLRNVKNTAILLLVALFPAMQSCSFSSPEKQLQKYAKLYSEKEISNSQMLFEIGKVFLKNPDNREVKKEYFAKMIVSGYSSHVLHHYLSQSGKKISGQDMKTIMFALQEGKHYNLAKKFKGIFYGEYTEKLEQIIAVNDSLLFYNQHIRNKNQPGLLAERGKYFLKLGEQEIARIDFDRAMQMEPCNPDALFQNILIQFGKENSRRVMDLIKKCRDTQDMEWKTAFFELAHNIEYVKQSNESQEKKLFEMANLYVNGGFPEIALRKSKKLLENNYDNPDYLALQAFIYYRMNQKEQALKYISEAEKFSGESSRLKKMIVNMK